MICSYPSLNPLNDPDKDNAKPLLLCLSFTVFPSVWCKFLILTHYLEKQWQDFGLHRYTSGLGSAYWQLHTVVFMYHIVGSQCPVLSSWSIASLSLTLCHEISGQCYLSSFSSPSLTVVKMMVYSSHTFETQSCKNTFIPLVCGFWVVILYVYFSCHQVFHMVSVKSYLHPRIPCVCVHIAASGVCCLSFLWWLVQNTHCVIVGSLIWPALYCGDCFVYIVTPKLSRHCLMCFLEGFGSLFVVQCQSILLMLMIFREWGKATRFSSSLHQTGPNTFSYCPFLYLATTMLHRYKILCMVHGGVFSSRLQQP